VKDSSTNTPIKINQDANIHVAEIFPRKSIDFQLGSGRQGYLLCIEGSATVTGTHETEETLEECDAAEIYGENSFKITPTYGSCDKAHVLLVEMALTGIGRTDF
jgi:redox-sensitive bicupin YhaK (pirin superfamily)